MRKILAKMKNAVLWQCVAIIIAAVIIIIEICVLTADTPKKALRESNFRNVKVTAYTQMAVLDSETWEELPEKEEFGTMTVVDGILYNETKLGKEYLVTEEGTDYVIGFVDDDPWGDSDAGHWEKYSANEVRTTPLIDLSAITGLTKKDFDKKGDAYILKENENEKLCEILQTTQPEKYICDYLRFYFKVGKLTRIEMGYYYGDDIYVAYEYRFAYDGYSLELPEI